MQREWEIARWQIMHIIAPYSKKKIIQASDIATFYWEKAKKVPVKIDEIKDKIEQWQRWEDKHG